MTDRDKQELVRLLALYQADLLNKNQRNIARANTKGNDFIFGVKAQYNHARCIIRKLSVEIEHGVKSYWEL